MIMKRIVSTFALIVFGFCLISCDKEQVEQSNGKEAQAVTLSAENGQYCTVTLSGRISGLKQVALDYQCGIEYSSDQSFPQGQTVRSKASNSYTNDVFTVTVSDIIPGQKYYYKAYYINQLFIYYGEVKEFRTDEWKGPEGSRVDSERRLPEVHTHIPQIEPAVPYCREPISRKKRPSNTSRRSMTLLLRFFSWKRRAPQRKLTITLLRRIMETMDTMEAL